MSATLHEVVVPEELAQRVERQIMQRTSRRVSRLNVEATKERVVVRGSTTSYYVKQLTIQAVLEALGPTVPWQVDVEVEVTAGAAVQPSRMLSA